jgi:hypothetical protein
MPIHAEVETYYREFRPHETSDAVVLRDADKHQLGGTLTSPDGQEFLISRADTQPAPNTRLAAVEGGMISCECDVEVFARSLELDGVRLGDAIVLDG